MFIENLKGMDDVLVSDLPPLKKIIRDFFVTTFHAHRADGHPGFFQPHDQLFVDQLGPELGKERFPDFPRITTAELSDNFPGDKGEVIVVKIDKIKVVGLKDLFYLRQYVVKTVVSADPGTPEEFILL